MRLRIQFDSTRFDTRILISSISAFIAATNFGCAQLSNPIESLSLPIFEASEHRPVSGDEDSFAGESEIADSGIPHAIAPPPTQTTESCRWLTHSRSGRAALAEGDLTAAEASYRSAIVCTLSLPSQDARVRASLGHLVTVAALHRRNGDGERAEEMMRDIRATAEDRGLLASAIESLDLRFEEFSTAERRFSRSTLPKRIRLAPNRRGFDRMIVNAAAKFDVDPALVKAVVAAESNFDSQAVSPVGAQGLMQLMPGTARDMGVDWPFDPRQNLKGGVRYLRAMLDRYGDTKYALAAYNAGPEAVDRHGGIPPYRETQNYVKRVMRFYANYQMEPIGSSLAGAKAESGS